MKRGIKFRVKYGDTVEMMSREELDSFLSIAVCKNQDITSFKVKDVSEYSTKDIIDLVQEAVDEAGEFCVEVIASAMMELQNNPGISIQEAIDNAFKEWDLE